MRYAKSIRKAKLLAMGAALTLLAACAIPTIDFGSPPATDALGTLTPNVSTDSDVVKAIGEPEGRGVAEHRPNERPRNVWFYYFVTNVGMNVEGKYLFVFLDDRKYEGYLWFSSNVAMKKQ